MVVERQGGMGKDEMKIICVVCSSMSESIGVVAVCCCLIVMSCMMLLECGVRESLWAVVVLGADVGRIDARVAQW